METQLAILERKIDDLLASADHLTEPVPSSPEEGLRNGNEEGDDPSENKRLEKGEASGNQSEKGSN